ncbi:MAG: hypothetical protein AABY16_00230 [Nanoarchaeota archaeon]
MIIEIKPIETNRMGITLLNATDVFREAYADLPKHTLLEKLIALSMLVDISEKGQVSLVAIHSPQDHLLSNLERSGYIKRGEEQDYRVQRLPDVPPEPVGLEQGEIGPAKMERQLQIYFKKKGGVESATIYSGTRVKATLTDKGKALYEQLSDLLKHLPL